MLGLPQSRSMEAVLQLPATQKVQAPQLSDAYFMQIPASELLFFSFSCLEGANSGQIWRRDHKHSGHD